MPYGNRNRDLESQAWDMIPEDWYEFIIEDWKEKLDDLGFTEAEIMFSGFSSQGDGACFKAHVTLDFAKLLSKEQKDMVKAWVTVAYLAEEIDSDLADQYNRFEFDCSLKITQSGNYCHEMTMQEENEARYMPECLDDWWVELCEYKLEQARDLAREIYKELNDSYFAEYDYNLAELQKEAKQKQTNKQRLAVATA